MSFWGWWSDAKNSVAGVVGVVVSVFGTPAAGSAAAAALLLIGNSSHIPNSKHSKIRAFFHDYFDTNGQNGVTRNDFLATVASVWNKDNRADVLAWAHWRDMVVKFGFTAEEQAGVYGKPYVVFTNQGYEEWKKRVKDMWANRSNSKYSKEDWEDAAMMLSHVIDADNGVRGAMNWQQAEPFGKECAVKAGVAYSTIVSGTYIAPAYQGLDGNMMQVKASDGVMDGIGDAAVVALGSGGSKVSSSPTLSKNGIISGVSGSGFVNLLKKNWYYFLAGFGLFIGLIVLLFKKKSRGGRRYGRR